MRLLLLATVPLYLGPLLAGLFGHRWSTAVVFTLIFLSWIVVMRPTQFPRRIEDWRSSRGWVALAAHAAVQLLLVLVLFGIGRGLGGVLNVPGTMPVWLPLVISALAVPLSRAVWNPWKAAEVDRLLDRAIEGIENPGSFGTPTEADMAHARDLVAELAQLPAHTSPAALEQALKHLADGAQPRALDRALKEAAAVSPTARTALILHATSGELAASGDASPLPMDAFNAARSEPAAMALFAERAARAVESFPAFWWNLPLPALVTEAAATAPAEVAAALRHLAEVMERHAPEGDDLGR